MRIPRGASLAAQYVLDEWLPPRLRDSWWVMGLPMRLVLRHKTAEVRDFKDRAFALTPREFAAAYEGTDAVTIQGETDLNRSCTRAILRSIRGSTVLDAGCGRGYLVRRLAPGHQVTGADIAVDEATRSASPGVLFVDANVEALPFGDDAFDTVVCTHTVEHVQDLPTAIAELRRVARLRLIIVVPRQRPYRYTFSHHIQFFPYEWSLVGQFGHRPGVRIERHGDWLYVEDLDAEQSGVAPASTAAPRQF